MEVVRSEARPAPRLRVSRRKLLRWSVLLLIVALAVAYGLRLWLHSLAFVSTEDAYVGAHTVSVAAEVSGPVVRVYVDNNQRVRAADPLFDIDPRPYQLAVEKARAQWEQAILGVSQADAGVAAAQAQLAQRQAELRNARSNFIRARELVSRGFLSEQGAEAAATQLATAEAAVGAAVANVEQAKSALGEKGERNAAVRQAEAGLHQAELDLRRTHVVAPQDGMTANFSLRPGNVVQPGAPLFSIIGDQAFWVDANFKETELNRIRTGAEASVRLDMYPDHPFHGVVESVSPGSGQAFSLLPPQNATGNWVKVTQRVPVRVRVVDPDPAHPLRIGTTATVEVKTASETAPSSSASSSPPA